MHTFGLPLLYSREVENNYDFTGRLWSVGIRIQHHQVFLLLGDLQYLYSAATFTDCHPHFLQLVTPILECFVSSH